MYGISFNNTTWSGHLIESTTLPFVLIMVALFFGCSGQAVRVFNDQGLNEQELATVYTSKEEGLFGTSMYFKSVDGRSVKDFFDKKVEVVKVTPGKHTYEIEFHDQSFSLFDRGQHLRVTFSFDAISGHEYIIHFDTEKTLTQRLTFGGSHAGWIEDKTSGEKLPMNRPDA